MSGQVPVPTTMGKGIVFEPYNYFTDDVSTFKHLPKSMYRYGQKSGRGLRDATKPIPQCTIPDGMIEPSLPMVAPSRVRGRVAQPQGLDPDWRWQP